MIVIENPGCDCGRTTVPILTVTGVSHNTCPVEVREKFAFTENRPPSGGYEPNSEAVWLGTCNRTELYSVCGSIGEAEESFAESLGIPTDFATQYIYVLEGVDAAQRLFRLASGLESLVIGEDEILGQIRRALVNAQAGDSVGPMLTRMFQDALATGKRVRSETEINRFPASVSAAAASIVRERCGMEGLSNSSVLVIGAGDVGRAVARCLKGMKTRNLAIANRTYARAEEVARGIGAEVIEWPLRPELLAQYDAIVSCTSAPGFVLTRRMVEEAVMSSPPHKSIQLMDMAVPRDIDPGVRWIPGVHLNNIDDARSVVDDSVDRRSSYIEPAERIIREQLDGFTKWMSAHSVSDSIRLMRERADLIRLGELEWVMPKLSGLSENERSLVEQFSTRLVNKMLHTPTLRLRETQSRGGSNSLSELVRHAFDLEEGVTHDGNGFNSETGRRPCSLCNKDIVS